MLTGKYLSNDCETAAIVAVVARVNDLIGIEIKWNDEIRVRNEILLVTRETLGLITSKLVIRSVAQPYRWSRLEVTKVN